MTAAGYEEWYAETYPDGMGEGFGGWYPEREIREAWEAGHASGAVRCGTAGGGK